MGLSDCKKVKVKQSHYSPGHALRLPVSWRSQISRQSAHEVDKVVSPTHRQPLPPRKYSWYSFLLEAESTPGSQRGRKDYVNGKSNPQPPGLQRSGSSNFATCRTVVCATEKCGVRVIAGSSYSQTNLLPMSFIQEMILPSLSAANSCFLPPSVISFSAFSLHVFFYFSCPTLSVWGTRSRLRHCATNRKVAGSIPNVVTGIFHWHNSSCRTMALGSTQPLTETSTRNISWGGKEA